MARNLPNPRRINNIRARMRHFQLAIVSALALFFWAPAAHGWWEATLQRVDARITLDADGEAEISYELRYHVDRGRFEGITIDNPGRVIPWIRESSFVEDASGRRYAVRVMRRHRDGAYLVRIINHSGLRRGWVTVRLAYRDNLRECCLRRDEQDRTFLEWSALSWDVGMDRMTITLTLNPAGPAEPDAPSEDYFDVEAFDDRLVFHKIRPVRWFEMRVGAFLPEGFLHQQASAAAASEQDHAALPEEAEIVAPPRQQDHRSAHLLWLAFTALVAVLLLGLKWWLTATGYADRQDPPPPWLLPRVPASARWILATTAMGVGCWLQSIPFFAAGTLAFVAGVLLVSRGPGLPPKASSSPPPCLWTLSRKHLWQRSRRFSWASIFDGSSVVGSLAFCAFAAAAGYGVILLRAQIDTSIADAVAMDGILALVATFFTGRRKDCAPSKTVAGARVLKKSWKPFAKTAAALDCSVVVQERGQDRATPESIALVFDPPPPGTRFVELTAECHEGMLGWGIRPVAVVRDRDGKSTSLRASRPAALMRRLEKKLQSLNGAA